MKEENGSTIALNPSLELRESSHWPQHSSGKDDVKRPFLFSLSCSYQPDFRRQKPPVEAKHAANLQNAIAQILLEALEDADLLTALANSA